MEFLNQIFKWRILGFNYVLLKTNLQQQEVPLKHFALRELVRILKLLVHTGLYTETLLFKKFIFFSKVNCSISFQPHRVLCGLVGLVMAKNEHVCQKYLEECELFLSDEKIIIPLRTEQMSEAKFA